MCEEGGRGQTMGNTTPQADPPHSMSGNLELSIRVLNLEIRR
jgi:hypothetical protein